MQLSPVLEPASKAEQEIFRLRRLQAENRHAEALEDARALLAGYPENRDLLLIAAHSLRHLGRIPEALETLGVLEQLQPRFSRLTRSAGFAMSPSRTRPRRSRPCCAR